MGADVTEDILNLHYHLSILLLVDIVEATERLDLLPPLRRFQSDAESWVLSSLDFALNTSYVLSLDDELDRSVPIQTTTVDSREVSLIAIDPYPHHVVAGVQLLGKAIKRDYAVDKISASVRDTLESTCRRALNQLPSTSKSVQAAVREIGCPAG